MARFDDIGYFTSREIISRKLAGLAADPAARWSHLELARRYRLRASKALVGYMPG